MFITSFVLTVQQPPSIASCRIGAESIHGESANGTSKDGVAACSSIQDTFINFQPHHMSFVFDFVFEELNYPNDTHVYVSEWEFGVSEANISIIMYNAIGKCSYLLLRKDVDADITRIYLNITL